MAFDVYAGPLCRYFANDWKTVGQLAAEQAGIAYHVIRPQGCSPFKPNPAKAGSKAPDFRDAVVAGLKGQGVEVHRWEEDPKGEYFTDRPGWEGYHGVLIRYAYRTGAYGPEPTNSPAGQVDDPGVAECMKTDAEARHLLAPHMWVPAETPHFFRAELPTGEVFASTTGALLRCLHELCDHLGLDSQELIEEHGDQPGSEASLEVAAQYGLGVFLRCATWADRHRTPMILDY